MQSGRQDFPARLGSVEKLVTYAVGYGVGIGVPSILGIAFALGFQRPILLLLPVPFVLMLTIISLFRPTAFSVTGERLIIARSVGSKTMSIERIEAVAYPASRPDGFTVGLVRVQGIYGTFGSFWNRKWGRFLMFVTDHNKQVELVRADGSRVIVSPDDPEAFVMAVEQAALQNDVPLSVASTSSRRA